MKVGQSCKESLIKKGYNILRSGRRRYSIPLVLLLLLMIGGFLSSCVYYNTFYNAKKYFDSAQSQPLRDTGRPAPRAIQDYDKVIERCTYILTEHRDSRWADDALYLLARSMYYKRQSPLQAKERFQDLLRIFPASEYVPRSHIYIAKIDHEMRDSREAHRRLQEILDNPDYQKLHPEVLLLKSSYYLDEQDYLRAQNYLQMIIDQYPRSQEFEMAFFTLGKAHYESENYSQSKEIFEILVNSRASRRTKLNADYYIALNLFYLEKYEESLEILQRLFRAEYEQSEFPKLNLLRARCMSGLEEYDEAELMFKSVIETNRRTLISAEASYHLAEMYFLDLLDYEQAIVYYNRIQTEMRTSPYVEKGMSRSSVVSQIVQFSRTDRKISTEELINEQFKLAEYYLYVMNLPDSALSVYSDIEIQGIRLQKNLDSLSTVSDTTEIHFPERSDPSDTLAYRTEDIRENGDDLPDGEERLPERIETISLEDEIVRLEEDLYLYQTEFIPYSKFASALIWLNKKNDRARAEEILVDLQNNFPGNRYTYATEALLAGEEVLFVTPYETELENEYEEAINLIKEEPAETVRLLQSIEDKISNDVVMDQRPRSERISDLYNKTLFSLGYTYYFHLTDSLSAKPYFDEVLTQNRESEYSRFIQTFYQDDYFIVNEEFIIEIEEEEIETEEEIEREEDEDYIEEGTEKPEIKEPERSMPNGSEPDKKFERS